MAFDKPAPSPGRSGRGGAPDQSRQLGKGRPADRNASADQNNAADRSSSANGRGSLDRDSSTAPGVESTDLDSAGRYSAGRYNAGVDGTGRAWPRVRAAAPGNPSPIDRALLAPPILGRAVPPDIAVTTGRAAAVGRRPGSEQEPGGASDGPSVGRAAPPDGNGAIGGATLPGGNVVIGRATPPSAADRPTPRSAPASDAGRAPVVLPADDPGTALPDRPANAGTPALRGGDVGVHPMDGGSDPTDEISPTAGGGDTGPMGTPMPADDVTATAGPGRVTFELSVRTTTGEALRAAPRGMADAIPHAGTRDAETQSSDEQHAGAGTNPWSLDSRPNPWSTAHHGAYPLPRRAHSLAARPHTLPAGDTEPPTDDPHTIDPHTIEPPTNEPRTNEPHTNEPPTNEPHTNEPRTNEPPTNEPHTNEPRTNEPPTNEPPTNEPRTNEPPTNEPHTNEPRTNEPPTNEPRTNEPHTNEPHTNEPPTNEPHTNEPRTNEPDNGEPQTNRLPVASVPASDDIDADPGRTRPGSDAKAGGGAAGRRGRDPGLELKPMVHVADMGESIRFYELLGAEIVHGDRDSDWVLLQLGTTQIGLLAQPPDAGHGEGAVELNFAAAMPLDELEGRLRRDGVSIADMAAHRDFGVQLHIRTPDGLLIRISRREPDLYT
jgi:hypothetical protein